MKHGGVNSITRLARGVCVCSSTKKHQFYVLLTLFHWGLQGLFRYYLEFTTLLLGPNTSLLSKIPRVEFKFTMQFWCA